MRLLLVEDDPELVAFVRSDLLKAGFAIDVADNGIDAEHMGDTEPYDAIVLDLAYRKNRVWMCWRHGAVGEIAFRSLC